MKTKQLFICAIVAAGVISLWACNDKPKTETEAVATEKKKDWYGFNSDTAYGEHLVAILDCAVCHSPKVMTEHGPVPDETRAFSGRPADMQLPPVDRKLAEQFGLMIADGDMTAFMGPWGVSFAANITPHATGIGSWSEEKFITALREHKYKGIKEGRNLLPPMPLFPTMTDDELKAVYAYLRTVKPIENIVPSALPPTSVKQ